MTSLIKIQSFKVGKNDDNYVSKVLEEPYRQNTSNTLNVNM